MVYIGTAGWTIPKPLAAELPPPGAHLERYARTFPCAEINATFYRSPRLSTWERWANSVPEVFRFSVKAPKAITHEAKLACTPAQLQAFLNEAGRLHGKLGPLLFQLPPKLAFEPASADAFFTMLRDLYSGSVALEPRHASWFATEPDALLARFQVARVAADPARVPEASTPGGWPGLVYYRLHGSPRTYYSAYTEDYLQSLATSITARTEPAEAWCIFDNTASGAALGNALGLQRLIASRSPDRSPPALTAP